MTAPACSPACHVFAVFKGERCVCGAMTWDEAARFNSAHVNDQALLDHVNKYGGMITDVVDDDEGLTSAIEVRTPTRH